MFLSCSNCVDTPWAHWFLRIKERCFLGFQSKHLTLLPPTKLWEGNCVCHYVYGEASHVTLAHNALDLTIQGPPCTGILGNSMLVTSGGQDWRPVQNYSPEDQRTPPGLVATEVRTVGKPVVNIIQKWFLVFLFNLKIFSWLSYFFR